MVAMLGQGSLFHKPVPHTTAVVDTFQSSLRAIEPFESSRFEFCIEPFVHSRGRDVYMLVLRVGYSGVHDRVRAYHRQYTLRYRKVKYYERTS